MQTRELIPHREARREVIDTSPDCPVRGRQDRNVRLVLDVLSD